MKSFINGKIISAFTALVVSALVACGGGGGSSETAPPPDYTPVLDAPLGLSATAVSPTQIRLEWADNSNNETGFRVERSTDGVTFSTATTVGANVTSVVDSGLTPGTRYYYRVYAYNGGGDSLSPTNTADATTNSTPVRKLTVYLEVCGARVIDASHPGYVKVFSDDACTNEIASRSVSNYNLNKVVFDDVGQSPVYVMGFHDANGNGSLDADENRAYYSGGYEAPANPVRIEENGERTIFLDELDEDNWMPECSSASTINVTVNYTGSGTVDGGHNIHVYPYNDLSEFNDRDEVMENSTSTNGSAVSVRYYSCLYANIVVFYDADGDGKLSDGDPYEIYNNHSIGDDPNTLTLSEGSVTDISMSFDDSHIFRTRSLTVTVNYTGSRGTVSASNRLYVFAGGLTSSGPTEDDRMFEQGSGTITVNGGSVTLTGIYTSQVMVLVAFDADGDGLDRGDPVTVYSGYDFGQGYTPVSINPGETGNVTVNLNDTYAIPFDDYEDEGHPRWKIRDNDSDLEMEVLGVFPEVGTHTIGQNGIYGVMLASPDAPYEMCAYGGTITITNLDDGGNITGSFNLTDIADGLGHTPELAGTVRGTFSVPNDGSEGGTFTATGTVDSYAIDDTVTGTNVFRRPSTMTANVSNSPLPDGAYDCSVAIIRNTDGHYRTTLYTVEDSLVISGGSGSVTLYSDEGDDQLEKDRWYGAVMYLKSDGPWSIQHGQYHSMLTSFQYTGNWDCGSRSFSNWIQYVRNGALQSGVITLQGSITNCPVEGAQVARMYVIPEDFNRTEYAWPYHSNTITISGGSANCSFQGQGELYTNEHYRYVVFIDTDNNGFDDGDYYSVCEPAGNYDGSNPLIGLNFSSWAQFDSSGTAISPVVFQGNIANLSGWNGEYWLKFHVIDSIRGHQVYGNTEIVNLVDGGLSYSFNSDGTFTSGMNYSYRMYYDENDNNRIDEGEYVAASVDDVFDGTSPVTGINFDTWIQKVYGTEVGADIIIEGTISEITLDMTTRDYLHLSYVSTDYQMWNYDGCGGNASIDGSTIDVGSSPYAFEATNSGYMIVGKPYYYIMYLDSNMNWQMDPGEMRCILTNGGAGYPYDGSGTVTGLSFSSWTITPP